MKHDELCKRILARVNQTNGKQAAPLAFTYINAVLYVAELGKLSGKTIIELSQISQQHIATLDKKRQLEFYERFITVAEHNSLTTLAADMHRNVGNTHQLANSNSSTPHELDSLVKPQPTNAVNHLESQKYHVKAQALSANQPGQEKFNQENLDQLEMKFLFDVLTSHFNELLRQSVTESASKVSEHISKLIDICDQFISRNLSDYAVYYYKFIFEVIRPSAHFNAKNKKHLSTIDEIALLEGILRIGNGVDKGPQNHWSFNTRHRDMLVDIRKKCILHVKPSYKIKYHLQHRPHRIERIEQLRNSITTEMSAFLSSIFSDAEKMLGAPPCSYAVLGMGSIARREMTPYSDVECVIIVEKKHPYFELLLRLVDFYIKSLGESSDYHPGFHIDGEGHPLTNPELIDTAERIVEKYPLASMDFDNNPNAILTYTSLKPALVHYFEEKAPTHGVKVESKLFQRYLTLRNYEASTLVEVRKEKAKAIAQGHTESYFRGQPEQNETFQLKQSLISPLIYILVDLAIYYDIASTDPAKILDGLVGLNLIDETFAWACRAILAELYIHRLYRHLSKDQQTDIFLNSEVRETLLPRFNHIKSGIVDVLYFCLNQLFVTQVPIHPVVAYLDSRESLRKFSDGTHSTSSASSEVQVDLARAIDYLIYTINPDDKEFTEFVKVYQAIPISCRSYFLTLLRDCPYWPHSNIRQQAMLALTNQPNPDGWCWHLDEEKAEWQNDLRVLGEDDARAGSTNMTLTYMSADRIKTVVLHPSVANQLFANNDITKLKAVPQAGKRAKLPIKHAKKQFVVEFFPEIPGVEYATNRFARHIGDHSAPMCQLVRFGHNGQASLPVIAQITREFTGLNFLDTLRDSPEFISQIDSRSFTEVLLRVLLTNPLNDNGESYVLVSIDRQFRLMRKDNQYSFYEALTQGAPAKNKNAILPISILFALPQMNEPLSAVVLQKLLQLDLLAMLEHWVQELEQERLNYESLITESMLNDTLQQKAPNQVFLGLFLPENIIEELKRRLEIICQSVRSAQRYKSTPTGNDLYRDLYPFSFDLTQRHLTGVTSDTSQSNFLWRRAVSLQKIMTAHPSGADLNLQMLMRSEKAVTNDRIVRIFRGLAQSPKQLLLALEKYSMPVGVINDIEQIDVVLQKQASTTDSLQNNVRFLVNYIKNITGNLRQLNNPAECSKFFPALVGLQNAVAKADQLIRELARQNLLMQLINFKRNRQLVLVAYKRVKAANDAVNMGITSNKLFTPQAVNNADQELDVANADDMKMLLTKREKIIGTCRQQNNAVPPTGISAAERQHLNNLQLDSLCSKFEELEADFDKPTRQTSTKFSINPSLLINFAELEIMDRIGNGDFGDIYVAKWGPQSVSIKMVNGLPETREYNKFVREVKIMSRLAHPHIVKFYGACIEKSCLCLVMESMNKGTLQKVLETTKLNMLQKLQIALDIADGMSYIHQQGIVHRDLSSDSVLINTELRAKIADFGFSKITISSVISLPPQQTSSMRRAPEVVEHASYTVQSDIYSYGVVIWEIMVGKLPTAAQIKSDIPSFIQTQNPSNSVLNESFASLICNCCATDPNARPSLESICQQLADLKDRELQSVDRPPSPSAEEYFLNGLQHEKKPDYISAFFSYKRAAEKNGGTPEAWASLGYFFRKGHGTDVNPQQAEYWLTRAAEAGVVRAMINVAKMHLLGEGGIPKDNEKGTFWVKQAAAKGDSEAIARVKKLNK